VCDFFIIGERDKYGMEVKKHKHTHNTRPLHKPLVKLFFYDLLVKLLACFFSCVITLLGERGQDVYFIVPTHTHTHIHTEWEHLLITSTPKLYAQVGKFRRFAFSSMKLWHFTNHKIEGASINHSFMHDAISFAHTQYVSRSTNMSIK